MSELQLKTTIKARKNGVTSAIVIQTLERHDATMTDCMSQSEEISDYLAENGWAKLEHSVAPNPVPLGNQVPEAGTVYDKDELMEGLERVSKGENPEVVWMDMLAFPEALR